MSAPAPVALMSLRRRSALTLAVLACAVLSACGGSLRQAPNATTDGSMEVTLLHINDHHSHLDALRKTLQLSVDGSGQRVPVQADLGGFPRVVSAMKQLSQGQNNVIKIHAGDALSGSLYYNRAGALGEPDAAMMSHLCFDSYTLGNHEFDKGDTALRGFIERLNSGACKTPVLSANTRFGASSALGPVKGPGLVQKSVVLERGGQRFGIVGLTIAGKTKASSSPDKDTQFDDEQTAAQAEINALRAQGVKRIILASHVGYEKDLDLARKLDGVDVIIGGDSHTLLGPDRLKTLGVGTPQGPYPTVVKNQHGNTVCVAQAWEYGQEVGELKVRFDAQGQVSACSGTPHVLVGDSFAIGKDKAAPTAEQLKAIQADMAASSGVLLPTANDPATVALLAPYKDKVAAFSKTVVGTAPQELCSRRVPGGEGSPDFSRSSVECNAEGHVSQHGGDIQQLVVQAYLDIAKRDYGGADIALQSGGGARVPLKGDFTAANVMEVLPFGNQLFRLTLTGAEVKSMIEDGLEATFGARSSGPYPYTAGLRFAVNSSAPRGQRASQLETWSDSAKAWQPLQADKTYKLFVLSFNANGGDGYTTLANIPADRRLDIGVLDADVLQSYIDAQPKGANGLPELKRVPDAWYSTQSFQ